MSMQAIHASLGTDWPQSPNLSPIFPQAKLTTTSNTATTIATTSTTSTYRHYPTTITTTHRSPLFIPLNIATTATTANARFLARATIVWTWTFCLPGGQKKHRAAAASTKKNLKMELVIMAGSPISTDPLLDPSSRCRCQRSCSPISPLSPAR